MKFFEIAYQARFKLINLTDFCRIGNSTINQSGISTDISQSRIGKTGILGSNQKDKSIISQGQPASSNAGGNQVVYPETVEENPLEHDRPTTSEMRRKNNNINKQE